MGHFLHFIILCGDCFISVKSLLNRATPKKHLCSLDKVDVRPFLNKIEYSFLAAKNYIEIGTVQEDRTLFHTLF